MDKLTLTFWMLIGTICGAICYLYNWAGSQLLVEMLDNATMKYLGMQITEVANGFIICGAIGAGMGVIVAACISTAQQKF